MVQGVFAMLNKTGTYKGIDDMNIMQRFAYFMYFFWGGSMKYVYMYSVLACITSLEVLFKYHQCF